MLLAGCIETTSNEGNLNNEIVLVIVGLDTAGKHRLLDQRHIFERKL